MKLRDEACYYASLGWSIFPLAPRRKQPAGRLVPNGMNSATNDLAQVFRWWQHNPRCGIGLHCERSGFVVIDIDPRNGGDDSLHDLLDELGPLPATVETFSGGGGQHMLFAHESVAYRKELAPGVDIKANGYVILPPSIHPSGGRYEWSVDGHPEEVQVARLPEAWHERMTVQVRGHTPKLGRTRDWLKRVPARQYFETLTGRPVNAEGWAQCPFHRDGNERTPSLCLRGTLWACYACEPMGGKRCLGGNIFDLAGLLWGYRVPLANADYREVRDRLRGLFE